MNLLVQLVTFLSAGGFSTDRFVIRPQPGELSTLKSWFLGMCAGDGHVRSGARGRPGPRGGTTEYFLGEDAAKVRRAHRYAVQQGWVTPLPAAPTTTVESSAADPVVGQEGT